MAFLFQKSISVQSFLNCNKIKKLGATADDIIAAVKDSAKIEAAASNDAIVRKGNDPIP